MPVTSTTLPDLRQLLLTTVKGVSPSAKRRGADRWRNRRSNKPGPVSNNTRAFHLELIGDRRAEEPMSGWTTVSEPRDVTCLIVTDYSLPRQVAYEIVGSDNADLRDALSDLHLDGANGIWLVRDEDFTDPPEDGEGPFQIAHEFTVTYQRSRSWGS